MSQCGDNISQQRSEEMYNVPETDIILCKDHRLKIRNPRYEQLSENASYIVLNIVAEISTLQVLLMLSCKNQKIKLC